MTYLRNILMALTVLFISSCTNQGEIDPVDETFIYAAGLQSYEIEWEDRQRTFLIYYPSEEHKDKSLPVLFAIHGGGGTARGLITSTRNRFNKLADDDGFVVVYPEGFEKQWNDGRNVKGIVTSWDEDVNDVGFIAHLVDRLDSDLNIDMTRIFTSGISNGGFMSSRLLCDRSDLFKGGAIVTATLATTYVENCQPSSPNAVLVINGTQDPLVPYTGGQVVVLGQERGEILGTETYMQFLASLNDCNISPRITDLPDMEDDGTTVQIYDYNNCPSSKLQLYRIEGGGHTWPGSIDVLGERLVGKTSQEFVACDVIWDFFTSL